MQSLLIFLICFFSTCLHSCAESQAANNTNQDSFLEIAQRIQTDSTLYEIQVRIDKAFNRCFMRNQVEPLLELRTEVQGVRGKEYERLVAYWTAYIDYYIAVFYIKDDLKKESQSAINKGIDQLDAISSKNSEELALLSHLKSFAVQFHSGFGAAKASNQAKAAGQEAIKLDANNLRANLVLGSLDFYTPKMYGGGKKVEAYLSKAIELPEAPVKNPYLPTWGKEQAYELLVRYYIQENRVDDARRTLKKGLELFPDSYQLNSLVAKG